MATRAAALRLSKKDRVVVVLGAGATKACGGRITGEILPRAFSPGQGAGLAKLEEFLVQQFWLPRRKRSDEDYPQLPLLLDTSIDREHGFGGKWTIESLRAVRKEAEYAAFKSIADALRRSLGRGDDLHELVNIVEFANDEFDV